MMLIVKLRFIELVNKTKFVLKIYSRFLFSLQNVKSKIFIFCATGIYVLLNLSDVYKLCHKFHKQKV